MENTLNNRIVRIILAVVVGIPVTAVVVVLGFNGLILGYGGIIEFKLLPFLLGVVTVTGVIGIIGAWKRIYTSTNEMSEKEKQTTRVMLVIGCFSSLALSIWAFSSAEPEIAIFLLVLSFGAVVFIYATPKNSNNEN